MSAIGVVIFCFLGALVLGASLVRDLLRAAYAKGRKDADRWWLGAIKDVDEAKENIAKEEGAGWP